MILRVVSYSDRFRTDDFSIFEGNIKKDRAFWKKEYNAKAMYFELKEVK